jgi:putative transposase
VEYFKTWRETSFTEEMVLDLLVNAGDKDEDPLDCLLNQYRGSLKRFLEEAMRVECAHHLGFAPYQRGIGKPDSRNGYYTRDLETVFGLLEDLQIPRTRNATFQTKLFARYQRRQHQIKVLIKEMYVRGVSTRRIGEVLTPLLGIDPSASTVSSIAKMLDEDVKRYRCRPILDDFVYLFLDGVTMKVREAPQAVKKLVLCAYGITAQGRRELISFKVTKSESEAEWEAFLKNLVDRGLHGKNLKLIVTDGGAGMIKAAELVYYDVPRQRCWAHKARNVAAKVKRANQDECLKGLKKFYCQKNRAAAVKKYKEWAAKWAAEEPAAVACVAEDLEELLAFYKLPEEHWKKIRTTNLIERIFREVRRRTRPMSSFPDSASCSRIIFAVFDSFNRRWEHRPFRDFTQKG